MWKLELQGLVDELSTVRSRLDDRVHAKGRRVSDHQLASVHLTPHAFHGEWNSTIHPTGTL